MEGKRSFKIIGVILSNGNTPKFDQGRYISKTPGGAVRKMFTQLNKQLGQRSLTIHLQETTREGKENIFKYKVSRENNAKTVMINGSPITFEYTTDVKSL